MKVVNVLSSHYPGAFISVLLDRFKQGLESEGHTHETIDLYGDRFQPIMQGDDFNQFFGKPLPQDIVDCHELLRGADILTFFYPVWWNDMPAIMKGWIDRMFTMGFAYEAGEHGQKGLLQIKKVLLVCTLGNKKADVSPELENAMRVKEAQGVFGYCGVQEVEHVFLYDVDNKDKREDYLVQAQDLGIQI